MTLDQRFRLLGRWRIDPTDRPAVSRFGNTRLEFREDGVLVYTIVGQAKDQIVLLRFRVESDTLITDQPSSPRTDRVRFGFDSEGRLFLEDGEGRSHYLRDEAAS
jgi:hypothetical protein